MGTGETDQADPLEVARAAEEPPTRKLVILGASAGGLDALCRVFDHTPNESGAAFVVIQHLSPDHKTLMDTLLSKHTRMPVLLVEQDMPLQANRVHLIPPGKHLGLRDHTLLLTPKPLHGVGLPIDEFLTSAARQWRENVVGIILSGTGSDGSRGVVAVSEGGGYVLAQSADSAGFDGMPHNAVATGVVDQVLTPEAIGQWLSQHLHHRADVTAPSADTPPELETTLQMLARIATQVRDHAGLDLDQYKADMVLRRIQRRIELLHLGSLEAYANLVMQSPQEAQQLRREVLIPVTRFFRDAESFNMLTGTLLPEILEKNPSDQPLRIWVAATATGEEAYSMAMVVREACDKAQRWPPIKIYATDIEQRFLDIASAGSYPESIEAEVSAERLARFFTRRDGRYAVRPELRATIVFARHNLLDDPPFTRMNLVSCRNMLIYLRPNAQAVVLRRIQFSLAPGGVMLLGRSETPAAVQNDFSVVDSRGRLFKLEQAVRSPLAARLSADASAARPLKYTSSTPLPILAPSHLLLATQQLAAQYAPPSVLVDEQNQLVQVIGAMEGLLRIRSGPPTLDICALLPPELEPVVRNILSRLAQERGPVRSEVLSMGEQGGIIGLPGPFVIIGQRLLSGPAGAPLVGGAPSLLVFEPLGHEARHMEAATVVALSDPAREHVDQLERELAITRDTLQATIEELQTSNEELQSSNEELMAANEELQSTNEELQSVNEELYTVNSEYQAKLEILGGLHADLDGMSRAVGIPSIFVDEGLRLLHLTREATMLFNLREDDRGRSIEDFSNRLLDFPDLYSEMRRTMRDGMAIEREVRSDLGRWYLARLLPYGPAGATPGSHRRAVVSFIDLTPVKSAMRMQAIIDAVPMNIAVLDYTGGVLSVNRGWREFAEQNGEAGMPNTGPGSNYLKVIHNSLTGHPELDREPLLIEAGLRQVLTGQRETFEHIYPCHAPHDRRWFALHAAPLKSEGGGALVMHYNVTRWVLSQKEPCDEPSEPVS